MVEKLGLTTRPHPHPYYIQWVNSYDRIQVTKTAHIEFSIGSYNGSVDFDIVPLEVCQLLLGKPWISKNNVVHNTIANKYSFKYNGRKITFIPMTVAEILREDLMRAERRRNEPFRREWAVSNAATLSSKLELLKDNFVLPLVGTNILQHVYKEEDNNAYVTEKEHINDSGNHSLDVLNLSTNDANKATLEPSIDFPFVG